MKLLPCLVLVSFILGLSTTSQARQIVRGKYIVFENSAEALAWLRTEKPNLATNAISQTDPRYHTMKPLLATVWSAFQEMYPDRTADLPVPELVIVEGTGPDGATMNEPETGLLANYFYMTTASAAMSATGTAGLFAHELTHLLFPDFVPQYYQVNGDEPLGFLQQNDPTVQDTVQKWIALTEQVGPFLLPELNDLPVSFVYDGQLFDLMTYMIRTYGDTTLPACNASLQWRKELILKGISFADFTLILTPEDRGNLNRATKSFIESLNECLGSVSVPLVDIVVGLTKKPRVKVEAQLGGDANLFDSYPNVAKGLLALTRSKYGSMQKLVDQVDLTLLRIYSTEEVADDTSARILYHLGMMPNGIEETFLNAMTVYQPAAKEVCLKMLAANQIPGYGLLSDPHHSLCYRIYHVRKFAEWLHHQA